MTLNNWQDRLAEYFTALRRDLTSAGNDRPIFALEHNTPPEDWADLVAQLQEYSRQSKPALRHWLVWSVFAAEVGYKFKGDEYWQTFADDLPGWSAHEDRDYIKDALFQFSKTFKGAVPSGTWAKKLSLIAWPITHAVLPRDLQRNLASVLYNIRESFTPDVLSDPTALGSLIAANSEDKTSRFRDFVEGRELVGRIASALLQSDPGQHDGLLQSATLKRITGDLQVEQTSRQWLLAARQRASTTGMVGVRTSPVFGGRNLSAAHLSELKAAASHQTPRLELLARQSGDNAWDLKALLPNLSQIASGDTAIQATFASRRSFIDASDRTHYAPRFFNFTRREVLLQKMPEANRSVLRFEGDTLEIRNQLNASCSIPNLKTLIFRVRENDSAIRLGSNLLRPGRRYLLIRDTPFRSGESLRGSSGVGISCEGMYGQILDVPDFITDLYRETARSLGLEFATAITLNPVGHPPAFWNGEGEIGWHHSVPKVISITTSIETASLSLALFGEGKDQRLESPVGGHEPVFVDLTELSLGEHQLHVSSGITSGKNNLVTGSLAIRVIPDDDFILSSEMAQGFRVLASPNLPTMEELWDGSAGIDIYGPDGGTLKCHVVFHSDVEGKVASFNSYLGKLTLPFDAPGWSKCFDRVREDKKAQAAYDEAVSCTIRFRSSELGESTLRCEREFVPFRWSVRPKNGSIRVKLILTDSMESVSVTLYAHNEPYAFRSLQLNSKQEAMLTGTGGLLVARNNSATAAVVLPPVSMTGLNSLSTAIPRIAPAADVEGLVTLCDSFRLWTSAALSGDPLSRMRRDSSVAAIQRAIVESICGSRWMTAEKDVENRRQPLKSLLVIVRNDQKTSFEHWLSNACDQSASMSNEQRAMTVAYLAVSVGLIPAISDLSQSPFLPVISCFLEILRGDHTSTKPVAELDRGAASFALHQTRLLQMIRLLQLAARGNTANHAVSFAVPA